MTDVAHITPVGRGVSERLAGTEANLPGSDTDVLEREKSSGERGHGSRRMISEGAE